MLNVSNGSRVEGPSAGGIAAAGRKPAARSGSRTKISAREFLPGIGRVPTSPAAGYAAGQESLRFAARRQGLTRMESRLRVARIESPQCKGRTECPQKRGVHPWRRTRRDRVFHPS